jgi:hypothetical protein
MYRVCDFSHFEMCFLRKGFLFFFFLVEPIDDYPKSVGMCDNSTGCGRGKYIMYVCCMHVCMRKFEELCRLLIFLSLSLSLCCLLVCVSCVCTTTIVHVDFFS